MSAPGVTLWDLRQKARAGGDGRAPAPPKPRGMNNYVDGFVIRRDRHRGKGRFGQVCDVDDARYANNNCVCKTVWLRNEADRADFQREADLQTFLGDPAIAVSPPVSSVHLPQTLPGNGMIVQTSYTCDVIEFFNSLIRRFDADFAVAVSRRLFLQSVSPLLSKMLIHRVIHYDLKPNNMVVLERDDAPQEPREGLTPDDYPLPEVRIIDFGMSEQYDELMRPVGGANSKARLRRLDPPLFLYDSAFAQFTLNSMFAGVLGVPLEELPDAQRINVVPATDYEVLLGFHHAHKWPIMNIKKHQ